MLFTPLQDNEVTTAKIANQAITPPKLNSAQSGGPPIYGCRAWVNFNGTGTLSVRGSGYVSSVTDHGAGDYSINFSGAMQDALYSGALVTGDNAGTALIIETNCFVAAPTTTAWRVTTVTRSGGVATDSPYVFALVIR